MKTVQVERRGRAVSRGDLFIAVLLGGVSFGFPALTVSQSFTEVTIHSFVPTPFGQNPQSSLVQASDGNLYGTTSSGGTYNSGTVFRISDLGGTPTVSVIHTFSGGADGANPATSLIQASDGNLYGTTLAGGINICPSGCGTVFRISGLGGTPTESVVYRFMRGADGAFPAAPLIQAADGNLYGATEYGGTNDNGTIFRITDPGGIPTESVIYRFMGSPDGFRPEASLIQATDGSLYGTTFWGGANGRGTVFRISDLGGTPTETVIYSFMAGADGNNPAASLIQASDGDLYGTTQFGGTSNLGTVFKVSNLDGAPTESVVYGFTGGVDGGSPFASLIQASDGNLYGTTYGGAANGVVFRITNLAGAPTESVIHSFTGGTDGSAPEASLIQASDGNIYGTTSRGGSTNSGIVFQVSDLIGTPVESVVYGFPGGADGSMPLSPLIQATDGSLYGTTDAGGASLLGSVFRVSNLNGTPSESVLYSLAGGADGAYIAVSLIQASDGNLYGTTYNGGSGACLNGCGTVIRISDLAGVPIESLIHTFAGGADGTYPRASLVEASDGNLYGTTTVGGAYGEGTIFKISNLSGTPTESIIYSFTGGADGGYPFASLLQASDGNLYGTTVYGGGHANGTVFKISNLSGSPTESVVYSFAGGADGSGPGASVIQPSDGNLYGTTAEGGGGNCLYGCGTVFKITDPGGAPIESVIYSFLGGGDGADPQASLVQASDGNLYGTTTGGTANGYGSGTVFEISNLNGTPVESIVYGFTGGVDGAGPYASLIQATDGNLYGTTVGGGTSGNGTVFALIKPCFNDVPAASPFVDFICTLARDGVTAGCGGGNFCPVNSVLRSQMAVFILRGEHGSAYLPPSAIGIFGDVPASNAFAPWIEQLYNEGITSGCGTNPLVFCPSDPVTRASMAVLLLRAQNGPAYTPPACTGIFSDVVCPGAFTDWIEALYAAGITGGCNTNPLMYCPGNSVTRAQMAVFLVAAFNLP